MAAPMDDAYTVVSSNGDGIPMEDENGAPLANAQGGGLEGAAEGEAPWLQDQDAAAPAPEVEAAAAAPKPRVTSRFLSKYERARLLGVRSKQISLGAPPLVDPEGEHDSYQIALKELKMMRIPIIVRRHLPDGSYEDWKISELTPLS